jgi:hypothetical protein
VTAATRRVISRIPKRDSFVGFGYHRGRAHKGCAEDSRHSNGSLCAAVGYWLPHYHKQVISSISKIASLRKVLAKAIGKHVIKPYVWASAFLMLSAFIGAALLVVFISSPFRFIHMIPLLLVFCALGIMIGGAISSRWPGNDLK